MARTAAIDTDVQLTTVAMERFACLTSDCPDSCCRDWSVASATAAAPVPGGPRLRLPLVDEVTAVLGRVELDGKGACSMLDDGNLCRLQRTFGEGALPTACSVFPRTSLSVKDRLEVVGSLACPELARLYLLGDEPVELHPASRPMLPRPYVGKRIEPAPGAGADGFLIVREALLRVFRDGPHPVSSRLLFATDLAVRLEPLRACPEALSEAAAAEIPPEVREGLHAALQSSRGAGEALCLLLVPVLLERKRLPHGPRYGQLLEDVFSSIQAEALGPGARREDPVTAGQIWSVYERRRDAFDQRLGERADRILSRYCQHFLLRHPHTDSSTLLEHLFKLGLHLAAIRLLLCGHPELATRLQAPADRARDEPLFEALAVHVTQTFTKAIGHQRPFLDQVFRSTDAAGGFTVSKMVMLAKFV